ncbi:MAG TPA: hypothetical protein VE954_13980 [Oligoflexus sp.]|uniref:hypothetical protein n=1 Tax=Oligoflexus sp. TaxID=1971216 RepID=UPI002D6E0D46|nr:hypothetical protein [Oligoflexus sp.]HYX34209.1 hypothetical protein [Oligoflexus sp.]
MNTQQNSASPLSNLLYDFISVLHNKAEGLQACEKYLRDAEQQNSQSCIDMLNRVIEQDRQMVVELRDHLAEMMQNSDQFERSQGQEASVPH